MLSSFLRATESVMSTQSRGTTLVFTLGITSGAVEVVARLDEGAP